jgi:hypothetical protein
MSSSGRVLFRDRRRFLVVLLRTRRARKEKARATVAEETGNAEELCWLWTSPDRKSCAASANSLPPFTPNASSLDMATVKASRFLVEGIHGI